ncbi:MAG: hypothetical protein EAY66_07725 [Sphingobacteriales bacterium]|nr:MAG: hypothetical protein EAY66_07725 [Sphingobacteriales bacterium]
MRFPFAHFAVKIYRKEHKDLRKAYCFYTQLILQICCTISIFISFKLTHLNILILRKFSYHKTWFFKLMVTY